MSLIKLQQDFEEIVTCSKYNLLYIDYKGNIKSSQLFPAVYMGVSDLQGSRISTFDNPVAISVLVLKKLPPIPLDCEGLTVQEINDKVRKEVDSLLKYRADIRTQQDTFFNFLTECKDILSGKRANIIGSDNSYKWEVENNRVFLIDHFSKAGAFSTDWSEYFLGMGLFGVGETIIMSDREPCRPDCSVFFDLDALREKLDCRTPCTQTEILDCYTGNTPILNRTQINKNTFVSTEDWITGKSLMNEYIKDKSQKNLLTELATLIGAEEVINIDRKFYY